jgi:3-phenylpropionate/trans-cinnamate dioxygenase ferredoxin reductase component
MSQARKILVVGGGPAGTFAAIEARRQDPAAHVILLTDETCEPYEKPPLSKAVLLGKALPEDAPIAGPGGVTAHKIEHVPGRCIAIDRQAREIVTDAESRLAYDAVVIATGSMMRELPALPLGLARVHYLRTEAHARALRADLAKCRHVLVIGAGLIGLEVAASTAELGIETTVLEIAPRILPRVCDEETGALILQEHSRRGVDIRLGSVLTGVEPQVDGRIGVRTGAGDLLVADLVVVGTGVKPDDRLAAAAGLATEDGIIVDEQCRTSDPAIFAAGDVVRFPGPRGLIRLENWRHAQDHGAVAGRNAAGASEPYKTVPSFWSEQYDLYIQGVGWPSDKSPDQRVRRPLGKGTLLLETTGGVLSYALGINAQKEMAAVRRLIERRVPVDPRDLADPERPLAALLKAKA